MQCHDICENLSAYIDGMLDQSVASLVEQHLKSCPGCRVEYEDLLAVVELVRELPEVEPPPGFRDDLRERLLAGIAAGGAESAPKQTTRKLFGGRWVGMVAAAAVIFLTVGVTALWYNEKGVLPFPGHMGKMSGESELAQNKVTDRTAGDTGDLAGDLKAFEANDGAAEPRMRSAPASENTPRAGVQEHSEAPMAPEIQLYSGAAPKEAGELTDTAPTPTIQREEETPFSNSAVSESEKNEALFHSITALTDEEIAARDTAPPGMGSGPSQIIEYSVTLQVKDSREAIRQVSDVVAKHGGFSEPRQGKSNESLLITVPFYNAQPLIDEIGQVGTITDRQSKQKDVASEIQQLEKNIDELMAKEEELAGQLANQTDQTVEKELSLIREQTADLQEELAAKKTSIMMSKVELIFHDL